MEDWVSTDGRQTVGKTKWLPVARWRVMVSFPIAALALVTGFLTGAVFRFLNVPIPAPPNLAGILGIVGIYVGYVVVDHFDVGVDVLGFL